MGFLIQGAEIVTDDRNLSNVGVATVTDDINIGRLLYDSNGNVGGGSSILITKDNLLQWVDPSSIGIGTGASLSPGSTYYVTENGSDSNSGDSSHYHPISWVENSDSLKSGDELSQRAQNVLATKELSHLACELEYTITGNHGYSNIGNDKPNHDRATTGQPLNPKSYDKTQGRHTHTLSDGSDTTVGGGTSASSHTNVQPYIVLNYIIYYGVKSSTQTNNDPEPFDGERPGSGHLFG